MNRIIADAYDAEALLLVLYGRRPRHVHTLICTCGAMADLRKSTQAWDGWRVLPSPICPMCRREGYPQIEKRRESYIALVDKLLETGKVG